MTHAGSRTLLLALLSFLIFSTPQVLTSQTPPRDQAPAQPRANGVIRGRVIIQGSTAPLPRISVTALPSSAVGLAVPRALPADGTSTTDEAGAFEIRGLPEGRYIVAAHIPRERPQYLSTTYGSRDSMDRGKPIDLVRDGVVENVVIVIRRAAAIAGRVVNEFGEPVAWARVSALLVRPAGLTSISAAPPRETDDLGQFRVFGLASGRYVIKVEPPGGWTSAPAHDRLRYVPMFYPAVFSEEEAQRLTVQGGQDVSDIEIIMRRARTYRISGTVVSSTGQAGRSRIAFSRDMGAWTGMVTMPNGTFSLEGLTPGEYTVVGSTYEMGDAVADPEMSAPVIVRVDQQDVDGLAVTLRRGARISGRVVTDLPEEKLPASLLIFAQSTELDSSPSPGGPPSAAVKGDGTFILSRVFGPTVLRTGFVGRFREIVEYKGKDITDVPTEFKEAGDPRDLQIVLTDKGATITGRVTTAGGLPVSDAAVFLFSADEHRWTGWARSSRFGTPDARGSFTIGQVAAGKYLVVALGTEGTAAGSLSGQIETSIYSKLASIATSVEVVENEIREVSLTVSKMPQ